MSLLYNVREFMSEQALPGRSDRIVHSVAEIDVSAMRKCERAELPADLTRLGIAMNAHSREVTTEGVFHSLASHRRERLSLGLPGDQPIGDRQCRPGAWRRYMDLSLAKDARAGRTHLESSIGLQQPLHCLIS